MKIIVYHRMYGCDTGCCGLVVEPDEGKSHFDFGHPFFAAWGKDHQENFRGFAEDLVREYFGEEHVKDLDWENCTICDD